MKYAMYSEYKTSSSNWLDAFPSHWNVKPLKLIVKMPITDGPHETPEFIPDGVPFASVEAVWDGKVHLSSVRGYISEEDHRRYGKKYHPKKGDIFIVKSGSTTGKIAIVDFDDDFNVWSPLAAVRCDDRQAHPEFVFYALSSSYFQRLVQVSWSFGTQPNIGMGVLGNLPAVLPPLAEQQAIARFLDAKTAQIDALVAQKRQLIDKLKEKRQALIARTVTRGLPPEAAKVAGLEPNPEMKNANQLWLGEIPLHWGVKPLKFVTKIKTGFAFSSDDFTDEGVPVVRIGDISRDGQVDLSDAKYLPVEYQRSHAAVRIKNNDILMAMTGATIGKAARYTANSPALLNQRVCAFRALPTFHQGYLWFILNSDFYIRYVLLIAFGGAQPNISDKQLLDCCVPVPPLKEQVEISMFLEIETGKLDDLMTQANLAIDRLTEYRQALITSAVTGKIDLRELA